MRRTWAFLLVAVLLLAGIAAGQDKSGGMPTSPNFRILSVDSGGFCYLTQAPTLFPNASAPQTVKTHAISNGVAAGFGNVRIDQLQTLTFDTPFGTSKITGVMMITFTDPQASATAEPDHIVLSYLGTGKALNPAGQGAMKGAFTVVSGSGRFAGMRGNGLWAGSVAYTAPPKYWNAGDFKMLVPDGTTPPNYSMESVPAFAAPVCSINLQTVGYLVKQSSMM